MATISHKLKKSLPIILYSIFFNLSSVIGNKETENKLCFDASFVRFLSYLNDLPWLNKADLVDDILIDKKHVFPLHRLREFGNNSCIDFPLKKILEDSMNGNNIDSDLSEISSIQRSLSETARFGFGKNSFLAGFGLGFLAFALKKLLLPVFIGAQIVKSILIAMFLPSILGSVGKLVGKGVTTFAQSSGSSNFAGAVNDNINDFDFKDPAAQSNPSYDSDTAGSDSTYNTIWTYPTASSGNTYSDMSNYLQQSNPAISLPSFHPINSATLSNNNVVGNDYGTNTHLKPFKYTSKLKDASQNKHYSGSFYSKEKSEDFKIFHNIPSSSHLLANYDPFYSPLLSRIDSVFMQLNYGTEPCRERLVCNMYKNPAKYAPFSNLVSAQLSRELNELKKPSSDNPEILRFFKYMKAAKNGQDGQECDVVYSECTTVRASNENAPMVSTYYEINKLVHARKL